VILICEDVWSEDFASLQDRIPIKHEPNLWSRKEDLLVALKDAQALVVRNRTQVTRELIEAAPRLKVIARAGVGLDNIDIKAADEKGVAVIAALGINATAVAELTLGLALALARKITQRDQETRSGAWNRISGIELTGKTWGILGYGATGKAVARLLSGFNCRILAYDPFVTEVSGAILADLDQVIRESEILSIHLPATAATSGLVKKELIEKMRTDALIVNVGRGEVIDEADLETALREGSIAGAALDVRASEPPQDDRFKDLANVILTPHIAGITKESQAAINRILVSEIELAFAGKAQNHAVGSVKQVFG
jgi:D-3-phosphoglycerate dehydrogenase